MQDFKIFKYCGTFTKVYVPKKYLSTFKVEMKHNKINLKEHAEYMFPLKVKGTGKKLTTIGYDFILEDAQKKAEVQKIITRIKKSH